ncbi:MAG: hypothetical protein VW492_18310, partial [Deltaproteobacteria bacterium]
MDRLLHLQPLLLLIIQLLLQLLDLLGQFQQFFRNFIEIGDGHSGGLCWYFWLVPKPFRSMISKRHCKNMEHCLLKLKHDGDAESLSPS